MSDEMTSTEVARRFGDVLAEVKHGRRSVVVTKNGEPVAELRPVGPAASGCTLREFAEAWDAGRSEPHDSFADDLAAVNASDHPAANPWE